MAMSLLSELDHPEEGVGGLWEAIKGEVLLKHLKVHFEYLTLLFWQESLWKY